MKKSALIILLLLIEFTVVSAQGKKKVIGNNDIEILNLINHMDSKIDQQSVVFVVQIDVIWEDEIWFKIYPVNSIEIFLEHNVGYKIKSDRGFGIYLLRNSYTYNLFELDQDDIRFKFIDKSKLVELDLSSLKNIYKSSFITDVILGNHTEECPYYLEIRYYPKLKCKVDAQIINRINRERKDISNLW